MLTSLLQFGAVAGCAQMVYHTQQLPAAPGTGGCVKLRGSADKGNSPCATVEAIFSTQISSTAVVLKFVCLFFYIKDC